VDRSHLPSAFFHPLLDLLEHGRVVFLDERVDAGLALGVGQVGILLHEREHAGEGVVGGRAGLGPAPHPVHVDVAVSDAVDGEGFGFFGYLGELGFGLLYCAA